MDGGNSSSRPGSLAESQPARLLAESAGDPMGTSGAPARTSWGSWLWKVFKVAGVAGLLAVLGGVATILW